MCLAHPVREDLGLGIGIFEAQVPIRGTPDLLDYAPGAVLPVSSACVDSEAPKWPCDTRGISRCCMCSALTAKFDYASIV